MPAPRPISAALGYSRPLSAALGCSRLLPISPDLGCSPHQVATLKRGWELAANESGITLGTTADLFGILASLTPEEPQGEGQPRDSREG